MEDQGLTTSEVSKVVTSQKKEIEELVEEKEYSKEELEQLIEAEKSGKDRKTVKNLLKDYKKNLRVRKEIEAAEEEIEHLEGILENLESAEEIEATGKKGGKNPSQDELLDMLSMTVEELKDEVNEKNFSIEGLIQILKAEKKINSRKTAIEFLERRIKKKKLERDARETEEDIENLKEDIEDIEEDEGLMKESEKEEDDVEESPDEEEEVSGDEKDEEDESEQEEDDWESKKEIEGELDRDIKDETLKSMSLEDLQELKHEKERRENLVSELQEKGLDEEKLRKASTTDLKKLKNSMEEPSQESDGDKKTEEEIKEEAEEDLQMLMGAGKSKSVSDDEEGRDPREKIKNFKQSLREKLSREQEEDEDESWLDTQKVRDKLDTYKEMNDREAAIKTAHIMKGFLEYSLEVEKEMTYGELSEELPEDRSEEMQKLANFFEQMQQQEYTEKIEIKDMKGIIEASEKIIEELEG